MKSKFLTDLVIHFMQTDSVHHKSYQHMIHIRVQMK